MSSQQEYRISPDKNVNVVITEPEKAKVEEHASRAFWGYSFLVWVILVVLFSILYLIMEMIGRPLQDDGGWLGGILGIAFLIVSGVAGSLLSDRKKSYKLSELKIAKTKEAMDRKQKEAESLASHLNRIHESSLQAREYLSTILASASRHLQVARQEYKDNAFDPFWTPVEHAAESLGEFDRYVRDLSEKANEYYSKLSGRAHTFPVFPIRVESLPDPNPVLEEFRRVVRMGQTNFHFANIWEHRKTREVLISGFRTLGEAVNNLSSVVQTEIANLGNTLHSDLTQLVEEQIRSREMMEESISEQIKTREAVEEFKRR